MTNAKKRVDIVRIQMIKESTLLYQTEDGNRHITSPEDGAVMFKSFFDGADRELFIVACLDSKNQPVNISTVAIGALNKTVVHPREVFKTAILSNAASIICAHNHPSGDPTPSEPDIALTTRLVECGELLGIKVLDHLIFGDDVLSMKHKGYNNF